MPYGTDSVLGSFQAINCLATFIRSLRDKNLPDTCPQNRRRLAEPNFEDDDEDDVLGVINRHGQPQTANRKPLAPTLLLPERLLQGKLQGPRITCSTRLRLFLRIRQLFRQRLVRRLAVSTRSCNGRTTRNWFCTCFNCIAG